ncbi:ABC transporter permease subunit [Paenibacillus rhizoplanae]
MPILLALVVNSIRSNRRKRILQTTVYMPYFISTVVLVALLQIMLSPATGLIDGFLKALHLIPADTNLIGDPGAFVPVYVISAIWQACGWNSIIFIAALSSVDAQQYDAARIDGANRWQTVWHVEIPAILPTIIIFIDYEYGQHTQCRLREDFSDAK